MATPAIDPATGAPARGPSPAAIGRWQLFAAAALFSTGGLAIKAITLTNWQVASFRSAIAALAVALILPRSRRGWKPAYFAPAAAYASTLILFVSATKLTTSANAIFLQAAAPLYLVFLGPLILRERVRRADLFTLLVMGLGMALFFLGEQRPLDTAPNPTLGNLLGAASGLTWSLVVISLRWVGTRDDGDAAMRIVLMGNLLAALCCLPMALPVVTSTPIDWAVLLYLGIFQVSFAYSLMAKGVRQVPALESSMILLAEPALNPVWTAAFLGEIPEPLAMAGGALVLVGTVARVLLAARRQPRLTPAGNSS